MHMPCDHLTATLMATHANHSDRLHTNRTTATGVGVGAPPLLSRFHRRIRGADSALPWPLPLDVSKPPKNFPGQGLSSHGGRVNKNPFEGPQTARVSQPGPAAP